MEPAILPGSVLPPEFETGPISQPISAPNQFGGVVAQPPINPSQAINDAAQFSRFHDTVRTLPPGPLPGAGPPVTPAQALAGAAPPMEGPLQQPLAPGAAPAPGAAAPAPARAGGGRPRPGDTLEQDITKLGDQERVGIEKTQAAKVEGSDRLAGAQQDLAVQQRMDAQELADRQEINRKANVEMETQERAALDKAKNYTIPDFWKGAEGARVGSVISVAAGAISAGILGGPNNALGTINKYTDDYFHKQKEKIDNLYKYAEQTGRINSTTRIRYAQELTQLQAQHLAVQQSIITRIESVKSSNQGLVDSAALDELLAKSKADQIKRVEDYRTNQGHISLMKAQTASAYASAAESKAKAAAAGQGNADKADEAAYKTYVQPRVRQSEELNRRMNALNSAKAGALNPNASYGEVISALEQGIAADSGAGVRGVSMGQLHSIIPNMMSAEGKWSNFINQNMGGVAGPEFRAGALRFIERAQGIRAQEARENADSVEKEMNATPYGKRTPDFAKRARDRLYPTASGPAAPAGPPPGAVMGTMNGRRGYVLNGQFVAM